MATPTPWTVFRVPDDAPVSTEALGTKRKFWFDRGDQKWLFKATRPGTGEHWAEVIVAALADALGCHTPTTSSLDGVTQPARTWRGA